MSGYIPAYPWANGRASGLSLNATRFLDELDNMGDYVEGFVGGGLNIDNRGTVTANQTLDMSGLQECLWIVTLGANGVKLSIVGMAAGDSVTLVLKQDGVGNRTLGTNGLPAAKWDDGAVPGQTLTANGIDIRGFFSDGTNIYGFDSGDRVRLMSPNEIRGGLQVDPFNVRVWRADSTNEWVAEWYTLEDEAVGQAAFQELEDGEGIRWTRFFVREQFRRHGIYTKALRWSLDLGVPVTASPDGTTADQWDGFKESKEGPLKIDKRSAKARAKVG